MKTVKCRFCPAMIAFVKTPIGKALPVNPEAQDWDPALDAGAMVVMEDGTVGRMGTKFEHPIRGYSPHWMNCPGAKEARRESVEKRKRKEREGRRRDFRRGPR